MFTDYTIDHIETESTTIKSFYLRPVNGGSVPGFIPGQYVNVKLNAVPGASELIRSYTLSDSPGKDYLRLTIKQEPEGKSSNYFYHTITAGDTIALSKPTGSFNLDINNTKPVVLLSGGVGITPMLSMAEYILERQPNREVHFIHSSRNKDVQPMLQRLQQVKAMCKNFNLAIIHSSPSENELLHIDYHLHGRITREIIPNTHPGTGYYICGPNDYIKDVREHLRQLNVPDNQVYFEYFAENTKAGKNAIEQENADDHFTISLLKSGKEILWDRTKGSLLELCESADLHPAYSCRMGTCSTCETKLVKGTYQYEPEPFMEASENNIFICCAFPTSDMEIDI